MRATHPNQITDLMLVSLNQGDADALRALYEDSAVLVDDLEDPTTGREAIGARLSEFLKLDPSFEVHRTEVVQTDELALVQSSWTIRWTKNDDDQETVSKVDLNVVARKQDNGHWLIAIDRPIEVA